MAIKVLKNIRPLNVALGVLALASCTYDETVSVYPVEVALQEKIAGVDVALTNNTGRTFSAKTDSVGVATLSLPAGIYSASVSSVSQDEYFKKTYNGSLSDIIVGAGTNRISMPVTVTLMQTACPLVIKEVYNGGCAKDDGSGSFLFDKCIIIYNQSAEPVSLNRVGFAMADPYNAESGSHLFLQNGILSYEAEDWIPAIHGIWYFQDGNTIAPYTELVVNVCGAIDNTKTYKNSINYANPAYYCMYDVESASPNGDRYSNTSYYPSPAEVIPTSHYLKTARYGKGNAWPFSVTSPALMMFQTDSTATPAAFANNTQNITYSPTKEGNIVYAQLKLPRKWVVDGVEVYNSNKLADCKKRLTPDIDNGHVNLTNQLGHALIRRIERYTADGHPIYQDTNNSTNDFYEADKCSLR